MIRRLLNFLIGILDRDKNLDPMKYLIVGLGNMGSEYNDTRHNIGFDVLDYMAREKSLVYKSEVHGDIAEYKYKGRTLFLLKPSTYMNLSGKAVRYWAQKLKIQASNLLIVLDDVNLDFGRIRLRPQGSDGGHNGLKSINETLGTNQYARLRLGIGNEFPQGSKVNFVLGKWNQQEMEKLPDVLKKSAATIKSFCFVGINQAMNFHNK